MADADDLDPKDFSSFEEYRMAQEMREETERLTDFTCGRSMCQGMTWCLWEDIDSLQDMFDREFFGGNMIPELRLLSEEDIRMCRVQGCDALPQKWHEEGSLQQQSLKWWRDMSAAIFFHKNNRVKPLRKLRKICHVDVDKVGASVYLLTAAVIQGRKWPDIEEGLDLIEGFLSDPRLFDRIVAGVLIQQCQEFGKNVSSK